MFFNKKKENNNETNLVRIGALLIHAAKIDENYSKEEEEIIKKTLLNLGAKKNNLDTLIKEAKQYEEDANQILDFTKNFYLSIWEKTDVPYSKNILRKKNKLDYESGDYAIPENWKNIFKEKIVFPSNMLSLGFKIKE